MRRISLQSVDLTNFKSFRSAHIDLHCDPGLRMVFGQNRHKPREGANGAGKSTFIADAPCFCLTGRSTEGYRASDLMTIGAKSMSVECGWRIDGILRRIRRSFPTEQVFVDGVKSDQRHVDELMGLSRERHLCSWLFGQMSPLFLDKTSPERGDLLDEVLGLGFWMKAADLATTKWTADGIKLQRVQREVARLEGSLSELPSEAHLKELVAGYEAERRRQVNELREPRRRHNADYQRLCRLLDGMQDSVKEEETAHQLHDTLRDTIASVASEIAVLRSDINRLGENIGFFEESGTCPMCQQEISEEFADQHIVAMRDDHAEKSDRLAKAEKKLERLRERLSSSATKLRTLGEKNRDRHALALSVASKKGEISSIDNRIRLLLEQKNPHVAQQEAAAVRRTELTLELGTKRAEETSLSVRMEQFGFWRQGYRRVRIFCLTRVLAELEVATMYEARSLGLVGYRIGFSGETETKSGTVRLGVKAVVEEDGVRRNVGTWSPGERQRMRSASALGLASLIQRYSGVSYDLEVWDEPSAWLSAEGIEDLFARLRERALSRGKSIWVCDPRAGLSHGAFDEVWNVIKDDEGSRIDIVRGAR